MPNKSKVPTINDVAERACVSKRTVSRVINKSDKVNKKTRKNVEQIIRALNFAPNSQARGLAANRSYLLGLIYDVPTLFIGDVQKGVLTVCAEEGYDMVVHLCDFGQSNLNEDITKFVNRSRVDGVIVLPSLSRASVLGDELDAIGIPYVRFSSVPTEDSWRSVVTDYVPAVTEMANHLVDHGHQRIAFISGPRDNDSSNMRREAFIHALELRGLQLDRRNIIEGAFTYESGVTAARKLLSRENRPTAIFAANDEMAFGVVNVASSLGIAIPDELSIVGFDGAEFAWFAFPSLSTICRPSETMAQLAARKLLAAINSGRDAAGIFESTVSPKFVARGSTGPATGR